MSKRPKLRLGSMQEQTDLRQAFVAQAFVAASWETAASLLLPSPRKLTLFPLPTLEYLQLRAEHQASLEAPARVKRLRRMARRLRGDRT